MPEFLTYIQDKLAFLPDDFNSVYIHHLSTLALKNQNNPQIVNFYMSERNCFNFMKINQMFKSKTLEFDKVPIIDFDSSNHVLTPTNSNEIIQLMRNYKSANDFPVWYFIPIWKTISSTQYERYIPNDDDDACTINPTFACVSNNLDVPLLCTFSITVTKRKNNNNEEHEEEEENNDDDENYNCELKVNNHGKYEDGETIKLERLQKVYFGYYVINPKERKQFNWTGGRKVNVKLQMYKVIQNKQLMHDTLMHDIKSFAVDWNDSSTEDLLLEITSINFKIKNFIFILLETLNMTDLIHKFGIHVVQCKVFCLFLFNLYLSNFSESSIDNLTQEDDEIRRLGREHSRYFAYQNRVGQFSIKASKVYQRLAILELVIFSGSMSSITLNSYSAMNFMNGKSDDYCDSMIYQLSEKITKYQPDRFKRIIWRIDFKGSDAVDLTGVTNQTITMAINSFLFLKTGLCIISPNFTENTPNSVTVNPNDMGDTLVIPYPSNKDDEEVINSMLFGFGVVIGSMIRCGVVQDIPFPDFIWNFFAGKSITKEDVYENDTRLRDQIAAMKDGTLNDHQWNYRDWNNVVKPILGFPEDKIVSKENVGIYETVVVDLRIKSLEKILTHIKKDFI